MKLFWSFSLFLLIAFNIFGAGILVRANSAYLQPVSDGGKHWKDNLLGKIIRLNVAKRDVSQSLTNTLLEIDESEGKIDDESLQVAEAHVFRPVLRYRIKKSPTLNKN